MDQGSSHDISPSHLLTVPLSYCTSDGHWYPDGPRSLDSVEGRTVFADILGVEEEEMTIPANYGFQVWVVIWMREGEGQMGRKRRKSRSLAWTRRT